MKTISVKLKGPGSGREAAVRALKSGGINIVSLEDITPMPHNGCRAAKKRRNQTISKKEKIAGNSRFPMFPKMKN